MTTLRICTVEPSESFITRVNGMALVEELLQAEKYVRENYISLGITPEVWDIEAKLFNDGDGAYVGEIRHLTLVAP